MSNALKLLKPDCLSPGPTLRAFYLGRSGRVDSTDKFLEFTKVFTRSLVPLSDNGPEIRSRRFFLFPRLGQTSARKDNSSLGEKKALLAELSSG